MPTTPWCQSSRYKHSVERPCGSTPARWARAPQFAALRPVAASKTFASGGPAQAHHVAPQQAGVAGQFEVGAEFGARAREQDGFLRQPFQHRAGGQAGGEGLLRRGVLAAIPFGGAGAGEQGVAVGAEVEIQAQVVAASDAAGRVDDDVVADVRAFGVEVFLHPQRAAVPAPAGQAGAVAALVGQFQFGLPAGVPGGRGVGVHGGLW